MPSVETAASFDAAIDESCLYTEEEMIQEIQRIAGENPERTISRDFFRTHSEIPEREWARVFATFPQYKRSAGLLPTRTASREIAAYAKHKSVEDLRDYNQVKAGWKESFLKPSSKRNQTFLVGSDMHDEMCDPFYRRLFVEAAKTYKPSKIILNGDIFDAPEVSAYEKRPREFRPRERVLWVSNLLADLRGQVPDAEINLVEGNHEYRLIHHIVDKSPFLLEILDLNGHDIKSLLGLTNYEVNYFSRADLATFTEADIRKEIRKNYYMFKDHVLFHHFPEGRHFGMPGVSGHHHKYQVWSMFNATYGAYNWLQLGAGSRRHVDYTEAGKWQNGFALVHVDLNNKQNTVFEYIDCTNETCKMNGSEYRRTEKEKLFIPI